MAFPLGVVVFKPRLLMCQLPKLHALNVLIPYHGHSWAMLAYGTYSFRRFLSPTCQLTELISFQITLNAYQLIHQLVHILLTNSQLNCEQLASRCSELVAANVMKSGRLCFCLVSQSVNISTCELSFHWLLTAYSLLPVKWIIFVQ